MAERELFQIGEVARMYHLSVGTLRHYERIGLLAPERTDPATGYRYYSARQLEQLTSIRYLRALDMPLEEITLIDDCISADPGQHVTEIRIPVK